MGQGTIWVTFQLPNDLFQFENCLNFALDPLSFQMTFCNLNTAYLSLNWAFFSFQITVSSLHNAYLSLNLTLCSFQTTFSSSKIACLSLNLTLFSFHMTLTSLKIAYISLNLTLFSFQMNGLRACRGRTAILRTLSIPILGIVYPPRTPPTAFYSS